MQVMGDWAKGEFFAANQQQGKAFTCVAVPGTKHAFSYNVDSFVFFKPNNQNERQSQADMASYILTPQFQRDFNRYKAPCRSGLMCPCRRMIIAPTHRATRLFMRKSTAR